MDIMTFLIRIISCFLLSIVVGIERQYRHRMVGLRTNVLVSLGAFMFMCISFGVNTNDETRIAAQIVSGIGFLGAGVILRDGNKIKGLNTAATLWCVAAIGTLTATGMLIEATVGTVLVLMSNIFLRLLSHKIMDKFRLEQKERCIVRITCKKSCEMVVRTTLSKMIASNSLNLTKLERKKTNGEEIKIIAIIVTTRTSIIENIVNNIGANPDVISVAWEHSVYTSNDDDQDVDDVDIVEEE